jgi:hypothetical protein
MDQEKRERLGHRGNYRSGFQPCRIAGQISWGFAPGWYKPRLQRSHGTPTSATLLLFALTQTFALVPALAETQEHGAKAQPPTATSVSRTHHPR